MSQPKLTADRFWARVHKPSEGCWLWLGLIETTGYGNCTAFDEKGAHRVAWKLTHGQIERGLCVLHRCDVRACVRPDHLFLGTKRDNFRDMVSKGRAPLQTNPERGEDHRRSKLSESDVRSVFRFRAAGLLQREIAAMLGVTRGQVSGILNGHSWTHLRKAG